MTNIFSTEKQRQPWDKQQTTLDQQETMRESSVNKRTEYKVL